MASQRVSNYFFAAVFLAVAVLSFFVLKPYFGGFLVAFTFAIIIQPFYKRVVRLFSGRRGLASLFTIFLTIVLVLTPFIFLGTRALEEALSAYSRISSNVSENIVPRFDAIDQYFPVSSYFNDIFNNLNDYIRRGVLLITRNFSSIFSSLASISANLVIGLLALFFFLRDGEKMLAGLVRMSPLSREHTEQVFKKLNLTINSVVMGMLFIGLIQGILAGVGYFLFGVPQPIFWGALTALASLIPAVGTLIVTIPAALYLFATAGTLPGTGMILWSVLIVGTIDNILRPFFMRRYTDIHPFLIFISILGGISFFGPLGILLGPLTLSLFISLLDLYPVFIHDGGSGL